MEAVICKIRGEKNNTNFTSTLVPTTTTTQPTTTHPTTTTTPTTTLISTTLTTTETTSPSFTSGFSFVTLCLILIPFMLLIRRRTSH